MKKDLQPVATSTLLVVLIAVLVSCIAGCSTTVPVTAQFPDPPARAGGSAMTACPQLKELSADPRISDVSRTINLNYGTYYECAVKVDTWIEWYHSQKKIFDNIGK